MPWHKVSKCRASEHGFTAHSDFNNLSSLTVKIICRALTASKRKAYEQEVCEVDLAAAAQIHRKKRQHGDIAQHVCLNLL